MVEGLECLEYVEREDIDSVWPAIEKGLDRLIMKSERVAKREGRETDVPWTKDQLRDQLKAGTFDLLLGYWEKKFIGWTMLCRLPREFTNEPILFILTGYGTNRAGVDAAFRDYDRIAQHCGIHRIAFCSAFRGWRHAGPQRGFRPTKVWFERII